jgi:hypothetical protein
MAEPEDEAKYNEARFLALITGLSGGIMQHLGKVVNPLTGKIERDLQAAQGTIDMLRMLKEKTKGNLTDREQRTLDAVISGAQLNYLDEVRAEHEKAEETPEEKPEEKVEGEPAEKAEEKPAEEVKEEPPQEEKKTEETPVAEEAPAEEKEEKPATGTKEKPPRGKTKKESEGKEEPDAEERGEAPSVGEDIPQA